MKYHYEIAPLKIIRTENEVFTYAASEKLTVGQIVEIPVGKRKVLGVVWREVSEPDFATREILRVISGEMPAHFLPLAKWLSEYYATPLAHVLSGILPSGMNKNRRFSKAEQAEMAGLKPVSRSDLVNKKSDQNSLGDSDRTNFLYNPQQIEAIEKLENEPVRKWHIQCKRYKRIDDAAQEKNKSRTSQDLFTGLNQ